MKTYRGARRIHRLVRRTAATRPMTKLYAVIQRPIDEFVLRRTGGKATASGWLAGVEITMLTTTGARTHLPRTVPVLGLPDDPDGRTVLLIASDFGRPRNPSWYHNLRADPRATVTVKGVSREMVARELEGAARDRGYRRGEEMFPGFTSYARWTNRRIPVLRPEPAEWGGL